MATSNYEVEVIRAEHEAMHSAYMAELSAIRADMSQLRGDVVRLLADMRSDINQRDVEAARRETRQLIRIGTIIVGAVSIASITLGLALSRPAPVLPSITVYTVPQAPPPPAPGVQQGGQ